MITRQGWIGVDLDGTLAEYDHWRGHLHVGRPIKKMVQRVRDWLDEGYEVRIVTARASRKDSEEHDQTINAIHVWLNELDLPKLRVTNEKDYGMIELWDDRAIRVERNTGEVV